METVQDYLIQGNLYTSGYDVSIFFKLNVYNE